MDPKKNLTGLAGTDLIDEEARIRLEGFGITTVEELVGQLASQPNAVRDLLGLDDHQLARVSAAATAALPPETIQAIQALPADDFPALGALPPEADA